MNGMANTQVITSTEWLALCMAGNPDPRKYILKQTNQHPSHYENSSAMLRYPTGIRP